MVPLYFLFYFFNEIMLLYIEDKLIAYKTTFFDWNRDDDVNIGLPSVKLLDAKIPHILVGVHHNRFGNVHQKHTLQTSLCALVEYTVSTPCKAIFYGAPQSVWLVHYWVCYRRQRHFLATVLCRILRNGIVHIFVGTSALFFASPILRWKGRNLPAKEVEKSIFKSKQPVAC